MYIYVFVPSILNGSEGRQENKGGERGCAIKTSQSGLKPTFPWEHYSPFTTCLSPYSRRQVIEKTE